MSWILSRISLNLRQWIGLFQRLNDSSWLEYTCPIDCIVLRITKVNLINKSQSFLPVKFLFKTEIKILQRSQIFRCYLSYSNVVRAQNYISRVFCLINIVAHWANVLRIQVFLTKSNCSRKTWQVVIYQFRERKKTKANLDPLLHPLHFHLSKFKRRLFQCFYFSE